MKREKSDKQFKLDLEREALESRSANESFEEFFNPTGSKQKGGKAPMVITADEINNREEDNTPNPFVLDMEPHVEQSSQEFLFARMVDERAKEEEKANQAALRLQEEEEKRQKAEKEAQELKAKAEKEAMELQLKAEAEARLAKEKEELRLKQEAEKKEQERIEAERLVEERRLELERQEQEKRAKEEEARQLEALKQKREKDAIAKELEAITAKAQSNAQNAAEKTTLTDKCKDFTRGSEIPEEKSDFIKMKSVEEILAQIEKKTQEMVRDDTAAGLTPDIPVKEQPEEKAAEPTLDAQVHTVKIQPKRVDKSRIANGEIPKVIPVKPSKPAAEEKPQGASLSSDGEEYIDAEIITSTPKKTFEELNDEFKTSVFEPVEEPANGGTATQEFATNVFEKIEKITPPISQTDDDEYTDEQGDEEEYTSVEDRSHIYVKILRKLRACNLRILATVILSVVAFICELPAVVEGNSFAGYIAAAALGLAFLTNFDIVKRITKITPDEFDTAAPVGFLGILAIIYNALAITVFSGKISTVCFAPVFIMLLTQFGLHNQYSRIKMNFKVVAKDGEKSALQFNTDQKVAGQIAALTEFETANILYRKPTDNIGGFMHSSLFTGAKHKRCFTVFVAGIALSIIAFAVALFSVGAEYALFAFMLGLCIACSPIAVFIANLPLRIAASRLNYYDAALFGEDSIEQLDNANVITAHVGELFPEGSVKLVNFKLLSPNPIDQTLLDACALTKYMNSPLAGIFDQITSKEDDAPHKVDSTAYEENMGISGWVDDRRVFIGNRTLMQAHGFKLPSPEIDKNILRKECFPVYLGSEGVLCALLMVKYEVDPEVSYEMSRLVSTGAAVLVKNCDANVSKEMLEDYFGLDEQSIYIMPHNTLPEFRKMSAKKDKIKAFCCASTFRGHAASVTAAIKAKKLSLAMFIIYAVVTVLALTGLSLLIISDNIEFLTSLSLGLYSLISLLIGIILPFIDRP